MRVRKVLAGMVLLFLAGCSGPEAEKIAQVFGTKSQPDVDLNMRWDHLDQGQVWTDASMAALATHGAVLPTSVPADIDAWCPAYRDAGPVDRAAFWTGLLSALSFHESTWNPRAVGGGGLWYGLVQILPSTARLYGCSARSGEALKNGEANLSCAVRIMARTVTRDGVVSAGMRGVAADWGPFHSSKKREDMRAWVSQQSYCQAG